MSTSIPNQQPAPTSTEVLAASIALAVERQLTDYMASVSRQITDLRTALDATRVELRAELHGEWKSALDTMHRELEEHAQQSPTVVTVPAEPQPAPAPAFDPAVIQNELDAVRGEFHVELVDRLSTLESKLTDDIGAKLAALEVAIGRSGAGFDEAVAAVSRRLHELDDATHSLLGRIDQLDERIGATDNSGIDQLKEQLSSALGEVMLVRIDIDRAVASTEDKIGKATLRMAEIEALLSDEMDVSSAVQLERLDEIERAIAELDPNHVISAVPAAAPAAMPAPAPELAPSPAPPAAPHAAPAPEITEVPTPILPTLPTLPRTGN